MITFQKVPVIKLYSKTEKGKEYFYYFTIINYFCFFLKIICFFIKMEVN